MLQDISPHHFNNAYVNREPQPEDYILIFDGSQVILLDGSSPCIPKVKEMAPLIEDIEKKLIYLFSIDGTGIFLYNPQNYVFKEGFITGDASVFRDFEPSWLAFAGITGCQLAKWYINHVYCGRCGSFLAHSQKERALFCENCKNIEYPKISPAVIVGITDRDKILLTKYAGGGYKRYALIAGFMEIGETLEDTVRREVMEEVGLKVKNIKYYKSQPWAFSDSLLAGFFAELDGSPHITLDRTELSEAVWVKREDIPYEGSNISLTREMIEFFRTSNTLAI